MTMLDKLCCFLHKDEGDLVMSNDHVCWRDFDRFFVIVEVDPSIVLFLSDDGIVISAVPAKALC